MRMQLQEVMLNSPKPLCKTECTTALKCVAFLGRQLLRQVGMAQSLNTDKLGVSVIS